MACARPSNPNHSLTTEIDSDRFFYLPLSSTHEPGALSMWGWGSRSPTGQLFMCMWMREEGVARAEGRSLPVHITEDEPSCDDRRFPGPSQRGTSCRRYTLSATSRPLAA